MSIVMMMLRLSSATYIYALFLQLSFLLYVCVAIVFDY